MRSVSFLWWLGRGKREIEMEREGGSEVVSFFYFIFFVEDFFV